MICGRKNRYTNPLRHRLTAMPPPPRGGGFGENGRYRPHQPTGIKQKLYALAKGSPFGRAGERSEPERVRPCKKPSPSSPYGDATSPERGRLWQRGKVSALSVNGIALSAYEPKTFCPCQGLLPSGKTSPGRGKMSPTGDKKGNSWREATERVRPQYERKVSSYEIGYCSQKALHAASCTGAAA